MLEKLKNLLEKYGFTKTASLLARYAFLSLAARTGPGRGERAALGELLGEIRAGNYARIVLRRGSFGWHTALFQRAQQLARAMARRDCLLLYEAAPPHDRLRGAEKLGVGLWLVNLRAPRLRHEIEAACAESGKPRYLMIASPESRLTPRLPMAYAERGWRVIYDYIDAISPEIGGGKRVMRGTAALYDWAMEREDVIVTASAPALQRDAQRKGKRALLVENGVDCAHFFAPAPCPEDARFRALLRAERPIVGFYGALARWLDYEALRRIAADGRFSLLLIGVKYDDSFDRELVGAENVFFLGPRHYEELPGYASRCDVLLVPFRKGELADAASPVKLFEYLALGRPVVAADTAECRRVGGVLIARDTEEYVRCIERALREKNDDARSQRARAEALAADWTRRAETLCAALNQTEEGT